MGKYKLLEKYNADFIKIIDFYVFNCPVILSNKSKVSQKAKTFEDRKITGNKLTELYNKIKENIQMVVLVKTGEKQADNNQIENNVRNIKSKDYFVFYEEISIGKTKTFFYYGYL